MIDLVSLGYLGLFISSFLAATILPFSSEIVLAGLLLKGWNPYYLVFIATLGNVLGSLTNYALGKWGGTIIVKRFLKVSDKELQRSSNVFNKYGVFSLLFAWVPVIGDPITIISGIAKTNIFLFSFLVSIGKLARYILVAGIFSK